MINVLAGKGFSELVEFQLAHMSDPRERFRILNLCSRMHVVVGPGGFAPN